jgi:hypothetical protein
MPRRTICTVFLIAAAIAAAQVRANNTTAELATGGLVFTKSPDIEMRSEDLFISMREIRVQYKFLNHSNREVVTPVAFPVPDLQFGTGSDLAIPTNDPENILGFTTTVNNLPIAALVERKALLNGIDKTNVQAAVCDGCTLNAFTLGKDCLGSAEVDVGRREVVQALVIALVIVVFDEPAERHSTARRVGGSRPAVPLWSLSWASRARARAYWSKNCIRRRSCHAFAEIVAARPDVIACTGTAEASALRAVVLCDLSAR